MNITAAENSIFQVDRRVMVLEAGKIVWEFFNPRIDWEHNYRATIYRMNRITEPGMPRSSAPPDQRGKMSNPG